MRKSIATRIILYAVLLAPPGFAMAAGGGLSAYADLYHTAWEISDGAPPDIWAIDQSPEGQDFPSSDMTALKILPTDETWIGYYLSGVTLLSHGRIRNFGRKEGLPEGIVYNFAQDKARVLWVAVAGGLARYGDGRWERMDGRSGDSGPNG